MIRKYGGTELARVLTFYGLIGDVSTTEFNICCPFHDDPKPSMRVTLSNGMWYCFGCGLFGNAYDFIKNAHPELSELQCLMVLEKIVQNKEVSGIEIKKKKKKYTNNYYLDIAKDYYYGIRQNDWYCPQTKEELEALQYMKERGFGERALTLCRCKANIYSSAYPIIFPILDNGRFMGWVSRTMNRRVEEKRKYLYNEGFKKRITLCGSYSEQCVLYICEGFLDYLSLRSRGHVKNVVAILGWHIADEQIKKIKEKGIKKVVCALDNPEEDKSGKKGFDLLRNFFDVVPFRYPKGVKDPGEMSEMQMKEAVRRTEHEIALGNENANDSI